MIPYTPAQAATHIPVIDLSGSFEQGGARSDVAKAIHIACRETGFFYVSSHGIPDALSAAQLEAGCRFFALPIEDKNAIDIAKMPHWRGYEGPGVQTLDEGSAADLKESFAVACDLPEDHPWVLEGVPGQDPNLWPEGLAGFKEQLLAYQAAVIDVGRHLMGSLACSVDLEYDDSADGLDEPRCDVRMLRYPPQPEDAPDNLLGAGAHTNWGSVTVLLQDTLSGLEVRNADGDWILAKPIPGTFIINIGQMMERFTGGIYKANLHRVRNGSPDKARYSVAAFFELEPHYRMGISPTCRQEGLDEDAFNLTVAENIEQMAQATDAAT